MELQPANLDEIREQVRAALAEDIGPGDISAKLIAADTQTNAELLCREEAVICGLAWAQEVTRQVSGAIQLHSLVADGDLVAANTIIAKLEGPARDILSAERTVLNFLQVLSATATQTRRYVDLVRDTKAQILDTRKTLPGFRNAQKYAVRCGGGQNHRIGLYDAFLIKENHIKAAGSISNALAQARQQAPNNLLEVEVETLDQLKEAIAAQPDRILLDNFTLEKLTTAVGLCSGRVPLEASGGIDRSTIAAIAATGVDFISVGTLTKDIDAIDFSLRFL